MAERDDYPEVALITESDGVVAVITKKAGTEFLSFSLQKQFERDGKVVRTSFLNRRHVASVRKLLLRVEEYLDQEADRTAASAIRRTRSTTQNG